MLSKEDVFNEHDCYVVYYIPHIGFVLVLDEINTIPSSNWNKYIVNKLINNKFLKPKEEELQFLIKQTEIFSQKIY